MKRYLTVGTNDIKTDIFRKIQDSPLNGSIKPSGGLWLTDFNLSFPNYNSWVDYILSHPYILFYKNKSSDPFIQPCSIISLKDNVNIFYLSNLEQYEFLIKNYDKNKNRFSFEQLSHYYDGIYIDLFSLMDFLPPDNIKLFLTFGVNSLILFNLDCIDYYHPGIIKIEPFDYECNLNRGFIHYDIKWDNEKKGYLVKKRIL